MIKLLHVVLITIFFSVISFGQCLEEKAHNSSINSVWMSCQKSINPLTEIGQTHWILYEFEKTESIESLKIWNINHEENLTAGAKRMRVDVSKDGASWSNLGVLQLEMAKASKNYLGQEITTLGTFEAQFVLFTILENHGGACSGLAEVQFNLGQGTTPTVDEYLSSRITISPNPADEFFNITLNGIKSNTYSYQLVDMTGRVIMQDVSQNYGDQSEIDIESVALPDGQYALRLSTDEGMVSKKIIITHPK